MIFMYLIVWIVDINNILIIFNIFCNVATVILMTQCTQIYSDLYNTIWLLDSDQPGLEESPDPTFIIIYTHYYHVC